ncbi:MAG: hypothetical protein HY815_15720 [Candidatus Riflebacteria bacterium]|nr:hypothetical protein [Candidatus Riflebacteria bacterium]
MLRDPFVRFWLRFVHGEIPSLEAGRLDRVLEERIRPVWSDFVAPIFEEVCRESVRRETPGLKLPFEPSLRSTCPTCSTGSTGSTRCTDPDAVGLTGAGRHPP